MATIDTALQPSNDSRNGGEVKPSNTVDHGLGVAFVDIVCCSSLAVTVAHESISAVNDTAIFRHCGELGCAVECGAPWTKNYIQPEIHQLWVKTHRQSTDN